MNKNILATAMLLALTSGAATAATVYEADGYKFQVSGDIEVNYQRAVGNDKEARINLDDADFGFYAESMVNDDLTLLGMAKFDGGENPDSKGKKTTVLGDLFVGAKFGPVKVTMGKQANFIDDVGVSTDYEVGGGYEAWNAEDDAGTKVTAIADSSNQVLKAMFDDGMFYIGAAVTQDKDGDSTSDDELDQFDVKAGVRFDKVELTAYYADAEKENVDSDALILEGRLMLNSFTLAALYGQSSTGSIDSTAMSMSAKYSMDKYSFSGGWSTQETDAAKDVSQWYANVGYDISKNAMVFAEIADNDMDKTDMGYAVGMRVFF